MIHALADLSSPDKNTSSKLYLAYTVRPKLVPRVPDDLRSLTLLRASSFFLFFPGLPEPTTPLPSGRVSLRMEYMDLKVRTYYDRGTARGPATALKNYPSQLQGLSLALKTAAVPSAAASTST